MDEERPSNPAATERWSARSLLDLLVSFAMLSAAVAVIWQALRSPQSPAGGTPTVPIPADAVAMGAAPVTGGGSVGMMIFSDFQCPYCGQFAKETWPKLRDAYADTGRVLFAFRQLPLPIHHSARIAAAASICAARGNRFWDIHDSLFSTPIRDDADVLARLIGTGIPEAEVRSCLNSKEVEETIDRELRVANTLHVSGTPTFLLGRIVDGPALQVASILTGARPFDDFSKALESLLQR
jgi:protein-disulfide isomerase